MNINAYLLSTANGLFSSSANSFGWRKNRPLKNVCILKIVIIHIGYLKGNKSDSFINWDCIDIKMLNLALEFCEVFMYDP